MDKMGGAKPAAQAAQRPKKSSRRHLLNNLFDFIAIAASRTPLRSTRPISFFLLVVAGLVFAVIYFVVKPFQQGFFCDDTSIQYPYKRDTIPMWLLAVYGGLGPIIIVRRSIDRKFDSKIDFFL